MADPLEPMLDLTRRLPPSNIAKTLESLCSLVPEYADDLLGSVDQPLRILRDDESGRDYLACDYNRDGDSFRSPWSNKYTPPVDAEDAQYPSEKLRELEVAMNEAFDTYREMYFEGGTSSVYLWTPEDGAGQFAGVVLLKKLLPHSAGSWDSIHVFESSERGRTASYKLTSTVMLQLVSGSATKGEQGSARGSVELAGSLTRQEEKDATPLPSQSSHIPNIGRLIEDMEIKLRNQLQEVYFGKTKDVLNDVRSFGGLGQKSKEEALRRELMANMKR